ncbi:MAG: asparagine synthase (glutamine-hydrolyzing) [Phycisphaerales bacterium]
MCGIFGVVGEKLARHVRANHASYRALLAHRGPDDHGTLAVSGCKGRLERTPSANGIIDSLFLHWRLAVLDPTERGRQPFASDDHRRFLVFNGEIYNYIELRRELESTGHRFKTRCDTEVLLKACEHWGGGALKKLVGMFAFALVDLDRRELVLVRDCFGIKPLYYTVVGGDFAFASEIKALLALPGLRRVADPQPVYDYLRWGMTDHTQRTFFQGIRQLAPGHRLTLSLDEPGAFEIDRFDGIEMANVCDISFADASRRVGDRFLHNVELHLRSDVRVGTALSGGIDSSSIVMVMRHLQGSGLDLHCFSHVTDDPAINEERWVDLVGKASKALVHKVKPSAGELRGDLDRVIRAQDEPFLSTSIYAQYRVYRLASEHGIKVMLDGQGADELFGGYRRYLAARMTSLLRKRCWLQAADLAAAFLRTTGPAGLKYVPKTVASLSRHLRSGVTRAGRRPRHPAWINARWCETHDLDGRRGATPAHPDRLRGTLYEEVTRTSLPALLRYQDRNSMAFSIESRVPFLTRSLAGLALSLPEEYIIASDGTSKAVFRQAMRGIVPDAVLARRDKIAFETPERAWLAILRPWLETILDGEVARSIPALRPEPMRREFNVVLNGTRRLTGTIWRWVNLVRWTELMGVQFER